MLFEVLKNSLRATVEANGGPDADDFPPIKVIVAEGQDDITIKISDEVRLNPLQGCLRLRLNLILIAPLFCFRHSTRARRIASTCIGRRHPAQRRAHRVELCLYDGRGPERGRGGFWGLQGPAGRVRVRSAHRPIVRPVPGRQPQAHLHAGIW